MWSFHLSLLSIITPKNCVDFTHCVDVFCIITSVPKVLILLGGRPCNAFLTLIINLFALSQIVILFTYRNGSPVFSVGLCPWKNMIFLVASKISLTVNQYLYFCETVLLFPII